MATKANEETLTYVLLFPNPFEKNNVKMLSENIIVSDACEKFSRIYKTTPKEEKLGKIPVMSKRKIVWLTGGLTDEGKDARIYNRDFIIAVISSVLYTISQELGLKYDLLQSIDRDEIFCKIYATEKWLIRKAKEKDYNLYFRLNDSETMDFMQSPPFASINLMNDKNNYNLFRTYDEFSEECNTGSLFTYSDKARLVIETLNERLDLNALTDYGVLLSSYCIHQEIPLKKLKYRWARLGAFFNSQPLEDVRTYFSEQISLYFAWLGTYSHFMLYAASVGLIFQVIKYFTNETTQKILVLIYAVFLSIWAMTFDQCWGRKEKILAWKWGTTEHSENEPQRNGYNGEFVRDEASGKMKIVEKNKCKKILRRVLSYSFVFTLIVTVLGVIFSIFIIRYLLRDVDELFSRIVAGIINALQIKIMDMLYEKLASWLNDWENHETQSIYDDNLIVKLFLFKFVNAYSSLFYIAFFTTAVEGTSACSSGCMDDLSLQLIIIFIVNLLFNFVELGSPWMKLKYRRRAEIAKVKALKEKDDSYREKLYQVEEESKLEPYESPLEDYMEMMVQFGYVALFSASVFYLPLLALIEILIEIRVDAWKVCMVSKRPNPERSAGIGIWRKIVLVIAYAGAISNSGIIFFTSGLFSSLFSDFGSFEKAIGFVALEHFLFFCMFLIAIIIPDVPSVVVKGNKWMKLKVAQKTPKKNLLQETNTKENLTSEDFFIDPNKLNYQI